jgi:hypothetical protein
MISILPRCSLTVALQLLLSVMPPCRVALCIMLGCCLALAPAGAEVEEEHNRSYGVFRKLNPLQSGVYPLSNVVRLSNGCSGMLVTSLHVLTSAACVRNLAPHSLRVFITDAMGGSVVYPRAIRVSTHYAHAATPLDATRHNYAVLSLHSRVTRPSPFLPLMSVDDTTLGLFKAVHYGGVLMRAGEAVGVGMMACPVHTSAHVQLGLLFTPCALPALATGSPLLVTYPATGARIVGVMARKLNGQWSLGVAFTAAILTEICSWLGPVGQRDGVCVKPQSALTVLVRGIHY